MSTNLLKNCYAIFLSQIVFISFLLFCGGVSAEEWKSCEVGNSTATDRNAAIAFGKIKTRISFFKKIDYASITIFLDGKTWKSIDLIPTGRGFFGDGKPYLTYADKTNSLIAMEFEDSDLMIVIIKGDIDFTLFSRCT
jgi:hypothetical protein